MYATFVGVKVVEMVGEISGKPHDSRGVRYGYVVFLGHLQICTLFQVGAGDSKGWWYATQITLGEAIYPTTGFAHPDPEVVVNHVLRLLKLA